MPVIYPNHVRRGASGIYPFGFQSVGAFPVFDFMQGVLPPYVSLARATAGSCYDENGNMITVAANQPRFDYDPVTHELRGLLLEAAATNLMLRSAEFDNAAWVKTRLTVTANSALAPDGTMSADSLVEDTTNNTHAIARNGVTLSAGWHTVSIFLRAAERTICQLRLTGANAIYIEADLAAKTAVFVTPQGSSTVGLVDVGGGMYRLNLTWQANAGLVNFALFPLLSSGVISYQGSGLTAFHLWGAQLEVGQSVTSYIPTSAAATTRAADQPNISYTYAENPDLRVIKADGSDYSEAAVFDGTYWPTVTMPAHVQSIVRTTPVWNFANGQIPYGVDFGRVGSGFCYDENGTLVLVGAGLPRFDHDPVTHELLGLLVEASGTNSILHSEDFSQAAWVKGNANLINVAGPAGRVAGRITENTVSSIHQISQNVSSEVGVLSVYLRCLAGNRNIAVLMNTQNSLTRININLSDDPGTVISYGAKIMKHSIVAMPDGWWLLTVLTGNTSATAKSFVLRTTIGTLQTYAGDGVSHVEFALPQFEPAATVASSYIQTAGTPVTRVADTLSITDVLGTENVRVTKGNSTEDLAGQSLDGDYMPPLALPARIKRIEVLR